MKIDFENIIIGSELALKSKIKIKTMMCYVKYQFIITFYYKYFYYTWIIQLWLRYRLFKFKRIEVLNYVLF